MSCQNVDRDLLAILNKLEKIRNHDEADNYRIEFKNGGWNTLSGYNDSEFGHPFDEDGDWIDEVILVTKKDTSGTTITLYKRESPLFDEIKKQLGYKMHESEIWLIVDMAKKLSP